MMFPLPIPSPPSVLYEMNDEDQTPMYPPYSLIVPI